MSLSCYVISGLPRYNVVFQRQSKQWISRPIYEANTQVFREELMDQVLQRWLDTTVIFRDPSSRVQVPHLPANIASILKLNKEDVIATHTSDTKAQQKNKYFQCWQYFGQLLVNNVIIVAGLCTSLHQDCWFTSLHQKHNLMCIL